MKGLCIFFKENTNEGPRKSAPKSRKSTASAPSNRSIADLRVFSVKELKEATQNFNKLFRIGEGGFGTVYKGVIKPQNGGEEPTTIVAIKKLDPQGWQGHKQWIAEIRFLGVLDHPNLVKLFGYCSSDGARGIQRLLVYEYMPNNSLEDHLFNKAMPTIPWIIRLRIILGAARGMAYLHEGLQVQVLTHPGRPSMRDRGLSPLRSDIQGLQVLKRPAGQGIQCQAFRLWSRKRRPDRGPVSRVHSASWDLRVCGPRICRDGASDEQE